MCTRVILGAAVLGLSWASVSCSPPPGTTGGADGGAAADAGGDAGPPEGSQLPPPDGGAPDAGWDSGQPSSVPDAGADAGSKPGMDAGADAGLPDARADAGAADAGADAGPDAGAADAGPISVPPGKIEHLVFIVNENHTFDNLFSGFPGADSIQTIPGPDGGFPAPQCPDALPRDLCHEHSCALTDWDDGGMDGWANVAGSSDDAGDRLAWCQYTQSEIPGYWALASNYALADHFHASMLGPSFPGHMFTLAAQAGWSVGNPYDTTFGLTQIIWGCDDLPGVVVDTLQDGGCNVVSPAPCFDIPSAPNVLPQGSTWKFYGTGLSLPVVGSVVWSMFDAIQPIRQGSSWGNVVPYSQFDTDVAAGNLPTVSWLVDQDFDSGHPPFSMCANDTWVTTRVNEILQSPLYATTAIVVTWDDFGGFYDHVPPPVQYGCDPTQPYGLGFRLPAILISPWVKRGVFHGLAEQASLVRLVEEVFAPASIGALGAQDPAARDGLAGSLLGAFDFNQSPLPAAPVKTTCP